MGSCELKTVAALLRELIGAKLLSPRRAIEWAELTLDSSVPLPKWQEVLCLSAPDEVYENLCLVPGNRSGRFEELLLVSAARLYLEAVVDPLLIARGIGDEFAFSRPGQDPVQQAGWDLYCADIGIWESGNPMLQITPLQRQEMLDDARRHAIEALKSVASRPLPDVIVAAIHRERLARESSS